MIQRPAILNIINQKIQRGPIALIAPSGYGKTTIIKQWSEETPEETAQQSTCEWLTLQTPINTPEKLFEQLTPESNQAPIDQKIDASTATKGNPNKTKTIIIDNAHLIKIEETHQTELTEQLQALYANHNLIIIGRTNPLSLNFFETVLSISDLKLTQQEQQALLANTTLTLPKTISGSQQLTDNIQKTLKDADGWPAIFDAVNRLGSQPDHQPLYETINHLLSETIEHLSHDSRNLLMQTALLGQINDDLHQACNDQALSLEKIEILKQQSLLIEHTNGNSWSISNNLLKHYLSTQYQIEQSDTLQPIIKHASRYFLANKQINNTVELAIAITDYDWAIKLISSHTDHFANPEQWQTLSLWFTQIPRATITEYEELTKLAAWQYIGSVEPSLQEKRTTKIPRLGKRKTKELSSKKQTTNTIETMQQQVAQSNLNDITTALQYMAQNRLADKTAPLMPKSLSTAPYSQASKKLIRALVEIEKGQLQTAQGILNEIVTDTMEQVEFELCINALILTGLIAHQTNDYEQLLINTQRAQQWCIKNQFTEHPMHPWLHGCLFFFHFERQEITNCETIITGLSQLEHTGIDPFHHYITAYYNTHYAIAIGDIALAKSHLQSISLNSNPDSQTIYSIVAPLAPIRITLFIYQKRLAEALSLYNTNQENAQPDDLSMLISNFLEHTHDSSNETKKAFNVSVKKMIKSNNRLFSQLAQSLKAIVLFREGKAKTIAKSFSELLEFTENHQLTQSLLNFGPFIGYIALMSSAEENSESIQHFLKKLEKATFFDQLHPKFLQLSKREREILAMIGQGDSNEEIANRLSRSIGTVKLHVHNLYQKLEIKNRLEAVDFYNQYGFE